MGANKHTTHSLFHPSKSLSQLTASEQIQKAVDIRNAPNIVSLDGKGHEVVSYSFDSDTERSQAQLCLGWVIDFSPYKGVYRVQCDGLTVEVTCTDNSGRGLPFSSGNPGVYPPGSRVIVYFRGLDQKSLILGSLPDLGVGKRLFSKQSLYAHANHMWHRIGCRKDQFHAKYADKFLTDYYGDGRPADTPVLGDFNKSNFMGGLINLSMWQLILRSSNSCGIWMNFLDDLMRQVSKNLQIWTPAGQINKYTTAGETFNYEGQALYDWEGLGVLKKPSSLKDWVNLDSNRNNDVRPEGETDNSYRTGVEPNGGKKGENITPFFRFQQYSGFFGHGGLREVRSLPKLENTGTPTTVSGIELGTSFGSETDTSNLNIMDEPKETSQVFRSSVNVSGTYNLQAAGGFSLERTVNMPCFWQKYEPYDEKGDRGDKDFQYCGSAENKAATLKGADVTGEVTQSLAKAVGVTDYHTREKYKPLYGFVGHEESSSGKDYVRVDPEQTRKEPPLSGYIRSLKTQQFMQDLPTVQVPAELKEGQELSYVTRTSGIYTTQDGGFLIRDAYGNEIRTGVNGIELYSVGDVTTVASRRSVTMAGDDLIATANKSLEMTAVQNDIRLQAFHNLETTSGVGGQGRTVIENRGKRELDAWVPEDTWGEDVSNSGIFMLAKSASVITYAKSLFTQCTGDIYSAAVNTWNFSKYKHQTKAGQHASMLIGSKDSEVCRGGFVTEPGKEVSLSNAFHVKGFLSVKNYAAIGSVLYVRDMIAANKSMYIGGSITAAGAIRPSDPRVAERSEDYVGPAAYAVDMVETAQEAGSDIEKETADKLFETVQPLYEEEMVGNVATVAQAGYSGRSQEQTGAGTFLFVMPASVSDTANSDYNKLDDFALDKFYAKLLESDGEGPFPGKTRWQEACCVVSTSTFEGVDPYTSSGQDQVEKYSTPKLVKPNEVFPAIVINQ